MNGDKSPFSQLNFNENKNLVGSVSLTFMFDAGKILSRDGGGGGEAGSCIIFPSNGPDTSPPPPPPPGH